MKNGSRWSLSRSVYSFRRGSEESATTVSHTDTNLSEDLTATLNTTLNDLPEYVGKLFKDMYLPGFEISPPNLCPENGSSLPVVIVILSSPNNSDFRTVLRQTEGYFPFARQNNVPIAFMIGVTDDINVTRSVLEESATHKDIILNRNHDTYVNLPLKVMSILEWFNAYCSRASYLLKVDDDVEVNVATLLEFVEKRRHTRNAIYGRLAVHDRPKRRRGGKYFMSEKEYRSSQIPDYVYGPTYAMTSDVPVRLYEAALDREYVHLEDVFFTGIVAERAGVRRVPTNQFRGNDSPEYLKYYKSSLVADYWDKSLLKREVVDEEDQPAKKTWEKVTVRKDFVH